MDKQKFIGSSFKRSALDARFALICICFALGVLLCVPGFDALSSAASLISDVLCNNAWSIAVFACVFILFAAISTVVMSCARIGVAILTFAAGAVICFASHYFAQARILSADFLRFSAFCFVFILAILYVFYNSLLISERLKALIRSDYELKNHLKAVSVFSVLLIAVVAAAGLFCFKII